MKLKSIPKGESRTLEQIVEHYEVEKELAARLKKATKSERTHLYKKLYDELYVRVPHHPTLTRKKDKTLRQSQVLAQVSILAKYFSSTSNFLELGASDCAVSLELTKHFKKVYALDISDELAPKGNLPPNFELVISDGSSVDVMPDTVDVAYSSQLMEHIHPDDAYEQLKGIYQALVKDGIYILITPHKYMGPSDISKYFDNEPTGFHLKEYSQSELIRLFRSVGFKRFWNIIRVKNKMIQIPVVFTLILELFLWPFPHRLRRFIARQVGIRSFLTSALVAQK